MSTIFGGDTGLSYEDVQRKRRVADALLQQNMRTPQNLPEGINSIARALAARSIEKKTGKAMEGLQSEADALFNSIFGGAAPASAAYGAPVPPVDTMTESQGIANDAMAAIGKEPIDNSGLVVSTMGSVIPPEVRQGIFAGESGGDYNALFGYTNRPGQKFQNVRLTDMTVDEALAFADPSGPYAQFVKGRVGHVATPMGAYQVVGTTLRAAKEGLGLTGNEKMTPELQDAIGGWIYKTQGTGAWEGYRGPGGGGGGVQVAQAGGPSVQQIAAALSNPIIQQDPGKVAILNAMLGQAMQANDPMRAIEMERAQLELEALRNPQPGYTMLTDEQEAQMGLPTEGAYQQDAEGKISQIGGGGTRVDIRNEGNIPAGYRAVRDDNGNLISYEAVPGGPEDTTANDTRALELAATASEVVTTAASRARDAVAEQNFGPSGTSVAGMLPWTDSAEVLRQVEVLKAQAVASNLQAMRDASPTGGALGQVTAPELRLLEAKSGALNPNSPTFLRDLEDYERTLLETIHGREEGRRIFEATRRDPSPDDGVPTYNPQTGRWE